MFIQKLYSFFKKLIFFVVILFIFTEVLSFLSLKLINQKTYIWWKTKEMPFYYEQLVWFEKQNKYHPYLTYYSNEMEKSLSEKKRSDEYTIAIIGGSFAFLFAEYIKNDLGNNQLHELIAKYKINKKIRFINLAAGGFKQPQQMITSLIYRDRAELFISIEGFNELVDPWRSHCLPHSWNRQSSRYSSLSETKVKESAERVKNIYISLYKLSNLPLSTFKLIFYYSEKRLQSYINELNQLHRNQMDRSCKKKDMNDEANIARWSRDIYKHHLTFQKSKKSKLITVFQPNQYDPKAKVWSDEEKLIFNNNQNISSIVKKLYPKAKKEFNKFIKKNPDSFLDLTNIFKGNRNTYYVDFCCHVNNQGNQVIFDKLFSFLVKYINKTN